jgi:hypothetical protein
MRTALGLLAIFLAACASAPAPPPCAVRNEWGVARAATPAAAERLSSHVLWLAPRVGAAMPGRSPRPVDARFVEEMHLAGMSAGIARWVRGTTIANSREHWIELPEGSDAVQEQRTLAHELVHLWVGPDWDTLPYFLEEGLAEDVRDSVVSAGFAQTSHERALILASALFGSLIFDADGRAIRCGLGSELADPTLGLEMVFFSKDQRSLPTVRETLAVRGDALRTVRDPENYAVMFCYGYLLVGRIGVGRLHALCLRARAAGHRIIPASWVLEAAGLEENDMEAWNRAIVELASACPRPSPRRPPPDPRSAPGLPSRP